VRKVFLGFIRLYQRSFLFRCSFLKVLFLSDAACRFHPSCSEYAYQAIKRYGIIWGSWLAFKRIIRCHPWFRGGYDPVPK